MNLEHAPKDKHSLSFTFWLAITTIIAMGYYLYSSIYETGTTYVQAQAVMTAADKSESKRFVVPGSNTEVFLATPSLVQTGQLWGLISKTHPLPNNYVPDDLIDTTLAHGDASQPMKLQKHIEAPLRAMYAAAEQDGFELMLSSAYRSITDQRALQNEFIAKQGKAMADVYVAQPGTSEHHTGMAVDLTSASSQCESDSNSCSLSQGAADWLAKNAPNFGFIQRYPEGKQPITGVAFEPWHYRYIGVTLARAMSQSGLTLDEVIEQMAPGLKKQ
jgi:LAS superfamily LD-carboxypeptidase LdcB